MAEVRRWASGLVALGLALALASATLLSGAGTPPAAGQAAPGATLSVLAPAVEVAPKGQGFAPAVDGQTLGAGDQVRTGDQGLALLTFFDGSETQLTPGTTVQVSQADASSGSSITLQQLVGTTVQQVQHIANGAGGFTINTPTATAVARGTRYAFTVRCYTNQPGVPTTALLSFPRRVSESSYLLTDEAIYVDGIALWETRSWADPDTGQTFQTHDQLGRVYPETSATVYREDDGSFWVDRTWEDRVDGGHLAYLRRPGPAGRGAGGRDRRDRPGGTGWLCQCDLGGGRRRPGRPDAGHTRADRADRGGRPGRRYVGRRRRRRRANRPGAPGIRPGNLQPARHRRRPERDPAGQSGHRRACAERAPATTGHGHARLERSARIDHAA